MKKLTKNQRNVLGVIAGDLSFEVLYYKRKDKWGFSIGRKATASKAISQLKEEGYIFVPQSESVLELTDKGKELYKKLKSK